ncbi:MAG: FAD-binding oxidoreductase [Candidatus Krumholzibacteriota bacterium]|nr:FAD-binding oxidoreductase [Candidatus Krumholzibacteriota bacterium]
MTHTSDVIIVGGGVNGAACAYNLARMGMRNVIVLEKGYPGCGATGRCGGGIRQQWGMEENVVLAHEALKIFEHLSAELDFNIFFRQGGYLMLIHDEHERTLVERTIPMQNQHGVPTRFLDPGEMRDLVPGIRLDGVLGGAYCPSDGTAYPYAVLWGYAEAARRLGAKIYLHTDVRKLHILPDGTFEAVTDGGTFQAPRVINVAGARTREVARMIGIDVPTEPYPHEIAVTEPLKTFLEPMVISVKKGFYFSQSLRGEVVGGISMPDVAPSHSTAATPEFLFKYAAALRETFPALGGARIIRQWAGSYDMSPDHRPIIGPVDGVPGYYHACGFSGHGFMLAPIVSRLLAELITTGETSLPIDSLNLRRFESETLTRDPYVVG